MSEIENAADNRTIDQDGLSGATIDQDVCASLNSRSKDVIPITDRR